MTKAQLIAYINAWIKDNNNKEITAAIMRDVLDKVVQYIDDSVGNVQDIVNGDTVVGAINMLFQMFNDLDVVHPINKFEGTDNPNNVPPSGYNVGDLYVRGGNQLYQYNGATWVRIVDSAGGIRSIVAGDNVSVNNSDPLNPIINAIIEDVEWTDLKGDQSSVNLSGFNDDIGVATDADLELKQDKLEFYEETEIIEPNLSTWTRVNIGIKSANHGILYEQRGIYSTVTIKITATDARLLSTYGVGFRAYNNIPSIILGSYEEIEVKTKTGFTVRHDYNSINKNETYTYPPKSGTIALLDDIPTESASTLQEVTENGATTDKAIVSTNTITATKFIDSDGTESLTGTEINMSNNIDGTIYNKDEPSAAASFSVINLKSGGYATNYIDTTGKTDFPTVTNAAGLVIPTQSDAFRADAEFLMILDTNGVDVEVCFVDYLNLDPIGGGGDKITVKPTLADATYTLTNSDVNKVIVANNVATVITVNDDSITRIGDVIYIDYFGTGTCEIVQGSTILLTNSNDTLFLDGQYSRVAVQKMSATQMRVFGQLIPA